jgi:hypothetical protein
MRGWLLLLPLTFVLPRVHAQDCLRHEAGRDAASAMSTPAAGEDLAEGRRALNAAVKELSRSAEGRKLLDLRKGADGVKILLNAKDYAFYDDAEDAVYFGPRFMRGQEPWQVAVILAHELEHARQRRLGLTGKDARSARELGAFLAQSRVWIELGGLVRPGDWTMNQWNSQDMWAWRRHPWTIMAALSLRGRFEPLAAEGPARAYWDEQVRLDAAFARDAARDAEGPAPEGADGPSAARFILDQALRAAGHEERASSWLPGVIEELGRRGPGASLAIFHRPGPGDEAVFAALPLPVAPVETDSGWRLKAF